MTETKPKHRWFRFTLRALLVVVTLLCVWLGLIVNGVRRQREAVAALEAAGGSVIFDYQIVPPNFGIDPLAPLPGPNWLRERIGDDYFRNVAFVNFFYPTPRSPKTKTLQVREHSKSERSDFPGLRPRSGVDDDDVAAISELNHLEKLELMGMQIGGSVLARLPNPGRLKQLCLSDTRTDDAAASAIGKMINLEFLWLDHTRITDAGLVHIKKLTKLKGLYLDNTLITDAGLALLVELKQLKVVGLQGTQVTTNGLQELHKSLPKTTAISSL